MIDDIDRQIILLIQENARLSNSALAKAVGLTTSTVYERIKKLEKKKIIKGYTTVVDADALGKPIIAFIRLIVGAAAEEYIASRDNLVEICQAEPDVLECHNVAGEDCYILKVRVTGPRDLEALIERIRSQVQISRSITHIVLSTLKESSKVIPRVDD